MPASSLSRHPAPSGAAGPPGAAVIWARRPSPRPRGLPRGDLAPSRSLRVSLAPESCVSLAEELGLSGRLPGQRSRGCGPRPSSLHFAARVGTGSPPGGVCVCRSMRGSVCCVCTHMCFHAPTCPHIHACRVGTHTCVCGHMCLVCMYVRVGTFPGSSSSSVRSAVCFLLHVWHFLLPSWGAVVWGGLGGWGQGCLCQSSSRATHSCGCVFNLVKIWEISK